MGKSFSFRPKCTVLSSWIGRDREEKRRKKGGKGKRVGKENHTCHRRERHEYVAYVCRLSFIFSTLTSADKFAEMFVYKCWFPKLATFDNWHILRSSVTVLIPYLSPTLKMRTSAQLEVKTQTYSRTSVKGIADHGPCIFRWLHLLSWVLDLHSQWGQVTVTLITSSKIYVTRKIQ